MKKEILIISSFWHFYQRNRHGLISGSQLLWYFNTSVNFGDILLSWWWHKIFYCTIITWLLSLVLLQTYWGRSASNTVSLKFLLMSVAFCLCLVSYIHSHICLVINCLWVTFRCLLVWQNLSTICLLYVTNSMKSSFYKTLSIHSFPVLYFIYLTVNKFY